MTFPRPQPSPARNAENRILLLRLQPASHVCREYYKAPSRLLTSAVRAATSLASPAGPSAPAVQLELQGADPQSEADASPSVFARLGGPGAAVRPLAQLGGRQAASLQKRSVWERLQPDAALPTAHVANSHANGVFRSLCLCMLLAGKHSWLATRPCLFEKRRNML